MGGEEWGKRRVERWREKGGVNFAPCKDCCGRTFDYISAQQLEAVDEFAVHWGMSGWI